METGPCQPLAAGRGSPGAASSCSNPILPAHKRSAALKLWGPAHGQLPGHSLCSSSLPPVSASPGPQPPGAPASRCKAHLQDQELYVHVPVLSFHLSLHLPTGQDKDKGSEKLREGVRKHGCVVRGGWGGVPARSDLRAGLTPVKAHGQSKHGLPLTPMAITGSWPAVSPAACPILSAETSSRGPDTASIYTVGLCPGEPGWLTRLPS